MADSFAYQNVDKIWIFSWHLKPPPVASALALVFRESKSTESESVFLLLVLKAPGHSKNSRNSGIPTKVGSIVRSDLGLLVPYWSLRIRPKLQYSFIRQFQKIGKKNQNNLKDYKIGYFLKKCEIWIINRVFFL